MLVDLVIEPCLSEVVRAGPGLAISVDPFPDLGLNCSLYPGGLELKPMLLSSTASMCTWDEATVLGLRNSSLLMLGGFDPGT